MTSTQRAREIFEAVVDLPVEARAAAIDRACGGDGALAGEVRELLRVLEGRGEFLSSPTAATAPMSAPSERAGDQIGPYKLLQQIGEGGFGVVFMAEQVAPIRRRVALKVIKLGMDTKQVIARFEAERQALAMMDHPNIARVFDAGATDTGRPYFAMELVAGMPITEYCDRKTLSLRERVSLMVPVCEAVQHAHHKGIIHRDLKPSNVLVTVQDGKPVPKIIDFGIAKAVSQRLTERTLFTEFGQFIGTPEYMSPEQADMPGLDIDARSDVYSLGVLLYELLAGGPPFDGATLRSKGFDEMRRIIREDEPPRLSARAATLASSSAEVATRRQAAPAELGSLLKKEHEWIVLRCMEKDRKRRYVTPAALAEDLGRLLSNEAVAAAPPSTGYQVRKFVRRHRREVVLASIGAGLVLLGLAGTSVGMAWALRERAVARTAELGAEMAARQARDSQNMALDTAGVLLNPYSTDEQTARVKSALRAFGEHLAAERGSDDPDVVRVSALSALWEWSSFLAEQPEGSLSQLAALDLAGNLEIGSVGDRLRAAAVKSRTLLPTDDQLRAGIENAVTQLTLFTSGDVGERDAAYATLIATLDQSVGRHAPPALNMLLERAAFLVEGRDWSGADTIISQYLERRSEMPAPAVAEVRAYQHDLALALYAARRAPISNADRLMSLVYSDVVAREERDSVRYLNAAFTVGLWRVERGTFAEAIGPLAEFVAAADRTPDRVDRFAAARARFALGQCRVELGEHAAAVPLFQVAVPSFELHYGYDDFMVQRTRAWLAEALMESGELDQAFMVLDTAEIGFAPNVPNDRVDQAMIDQHNARLLTLRQRLDELRAARPPSTPSHGQNHGAPP